MLGIGLGLGNITGGIGNIISRILSALKGRAEYFENKEGTVDIIKPLKERELLDKASIVLTPTAYSDGFIHTAVPQYKVLPTELVTNGTFDTDSDWIKATGITISDGTANWNDTVNNIVIQQNGILEIGKKYQVTFTVLNYNRGTIRIRYPFISEQIEANGTYTYTGFASVSYLSLQGETANGDPNVNLSIDNVSVKEIQEADFDFYRSSSATRVNENGLIEDVTMLGDERVVNGGFDTDTVWDKTNATISGGTANLLPSATLYQAIGLVVGKKYQITYTVTNVNAGNSNIRVYCGSTSSGTARTTTGTFTEILTCSGAPLLYFFTGGAFVSGSIDDISVKEVISITDIPRIDYSSGVGQWLFEPARTNVIKLSDDFTPTSVSTWYQSPSINLTHTSNVATSLDGTLNSDSLVEKTNTGRQGTFYTFTPTISGNVSLSVFVKNLSGDRFIRLVLNGGTATNFVYATFNPRTGEITQNATASSAGGSTAIEAKSKDYGNGWYRLTLSGSVASNLFYTTIAFVTSGSAAEGTDFGYQSYTGDGTSGIYIWGAQLEAGSYPTSYIPTSGATETRNADIANNSGNADLFNDSEGVLYAEIAALANDGTYRVISVSDGTNTGTTNADNCVSLYYRLDANKIETLVRSSAATQQNANVSIDALNLSKVSLKYKANDFSLWINGFEVATDLIGSAPSGLTTLQFNGGNSVGAYPFYGKTKELMYFPEALTDLELETLSSWSTFELMAADLEYTI